jgi:hypothetical protein
MIVKISPYLRRVDQLLNTMLRQLILGPNTREHQNLRTTNRPTGENDLFVSHDRSTVDKFRPCGNIPLEDNASDEHACDHINAFQPVCLSRRLTLASSPVLGVSSHAKRISSVGIVGHLQTSVEEGLTHQIFERILPCGGSGVNRPVKPMLAGISSLGVVMSLGFFEVGKHATVAPFLITDDPAPQIWPDLAYLSFSHSPGRQHTVISLATTRPHGIVDGA